MVRRLHDGQLLRPRAAVPGVVLRRFPATAGQYDDGRPGAGPAAASDDGNRRAPPPPAENPFPAHRSPRQVLPKRQLSAKAVELHCGRAESGPCRARRPRQSRRQSAQSASFVPSPSNSPVAQVSPATVAPQTEPLPSRTDQIKTILAVIGIIAILFHGLRLVGSSVGSPSSRRSHRFRKCALSWRPDNSAFSLMRCLSAHPTSAFQCRTSLFRPCWTG